MRACFFFMFIILGIQSCAVHPKGAFQANKTPKAPDYSQLSAWAAHPDLNDPSDSIPAALKGEQPFEAKDEIDVFFLHPTSYVGKRGHDQWNGPIDDPALNQRTDEGTILYQASIFNAVGQVYAPRYRQAHLESYFTKQRKDALAAFNLAYEDVKSAFQYYLEHDNQGRPIILATHSQGTTHAKRLIKEFFDGQALQQQLIVAYIVGIPVEKDQFEQIKACKDSTEINCFCSWRAYKKGKYPKFHQEGNNVLVTNPLSWTIDDTFVPKSNNLGGILLDFNKVLPQLAEAQAHDGLLWLKKPKFRGSFFYWTPNYHAGDFNLYYLNVRKNAIDRAKRFLETRKK